MDCEQRVGSSALEVTQERESAPSRGKGYGTHVQIQSD